MSSSKQEATSYLDLINAEYYFNDVVSLLIKLKPERPLEFMYFYFQRLDEYDHAGNRDFNFITETNRNRYAFISGCQRAFSHFDEKEEILVADFFQLVSLMCSSIPEARIFELPRLLKYETSSKIPFGEIKGAFFIHFIFYDFLVGLKQLFVANKDNSSGMQSHQRNSGWCPAEFKTVKNHLLAMSVHHGENDRFCILPLEFIYDAYHFSQTTSEQQSNDSHAAQEMKKIANSSPNRSSTSNTSAAVLTFDELVFRLLKNEKLANFVTNQTSQDWEPRDAHPAISDLFETRNSRGELGPEEDELAKYANVKPKTKEKSKAPRKSKPPPAEKDK